MTIEEIFSKIISHMHEGLFFHEQICFGFNFLALTGYSECHKYHYLEEREKLFEVKEYYMKNYKRLITGEGQYENVVPASWYKHEQMDVDNSTRRTATKDFIRKWITWEEETRNLLINSYSELETLGELAAANYIQDYLLEVVDELNEAKDFLLKLEIISYDIIEIMREQEACYKMYHKKIKNIF